MKKKEDKTSNDKSKAQVFIEHIILLLCLSVLLIRITYTEAPSSQISDNQTGLVEALYSVSVSAVLIFAFIIWITLSICCGRLFYKVSGIEIGLIIFLIACVISSMAASDKRLALINISTQMSAILGALMLVQLLDSPRKIFLVLIVIAALGVMTTYQCAEQFFISNQITIEQYEQTREEILHDMSIEPNSLQHFMFEHRLKARDVRGPFITSNSAGSFLLMASFCSIAIMIRVFINHKQKAISKKAVNFSVIAFLFIMAGLALTQSKGAIFSAILANILFIFIICCNKFVHNHRRLLFILAFIFIIIIGGLITSYGLKNGTLPGGNSMLVRWQYWYASAQMFLDHPFTGVGPGNFTNYYFHYKPDGAPEAVSDPHNFILSLLTQFGPLGLAGFILMLIIPLYMSLAPIDMVETQQADQSLYTKKSVNMLLIILSLIFICIRPILIPLSSLDSSLAVIYAVIILFIAPSAAFFIGLVLLAGALLGQNQKKVLLPAQKIFVITLFCPIIAAIIHNLIDFAIFEPMVLMTFWFILACLIAGARLHFKPHVFSTPLPLKLCAVVLALAVLFFYISCIWWPVFDNTNKILLAEETISNQNNQHVRQSDYELAHALYQQASESDTLSPIPDSISARLYLQCYQDGDRNPNLLQEAEKCLLKAISRNPAGYKNYEKLATTYILQGQDDKAYEALKEAVKLYPGSGRLWLDLAKATEQIGNPDEALIYYSKTIEIEDTYREQFKKMYPNEPKVISRIGEINYNFAKERIEALSPKTYEI